MKYLKINSKKRAIKDLITFLRQFDLKYEPYVLTSLMETFDDRYDLLWITYYDKLCTSGKPNTYHIPNCSGNTTRRIFDILWMKYMLVHNTPQNGAYDLAKTYADILSDYANDNEHFILQNTNIVDNIHNINDIFKLLNC